MSYDGTEYVLYGSGGLEEVIDELWIRTAVIQHAVKGEATAYFIDHLGPLLAPEYFHYVKNFFAEYILMQKDYYAIYFHPLNPQIEIESVMDAARLLRQYEDKLCSMN